MFELRNSLFRNSRNSRNGPQVLVVPAPPLQLKASFKSPEGATCDIDIGPHLAENAKTPVQTDDPIVAYNFQQMGYGEEDMKYLQETTWYRFAIFLMAFTFTAILAIGLYSFLWGMFALFMFSKLAQASHYHWFLRHRERGLAGWLTNPKGWFPPSPTAVSRFLQLTYEPKRDIFNNGK